MSFQRLLLNPKLLLGILALVGLAALAALYRAGLPLLRTNLGLVERNRLVVPAVQATGWTQTASLTPGSDFPAQFRQEDACNPLGLAAPLLAGCSRVADWEKRTITDTAGSAATFYLPPQVLTGLLYRQGFTLLLSEGDYQDVDELTLLTYAANATRIAQGDVVGVAVVTTMDNQVHVTPLHMGIETAEAMYDTPDVPPQHSKPSQQYPLPIGGLAYPVSLHFAEPITPASITVLFTYAGQWHVAPLFFVWGVGRP